jgi:hypothetical protein
MLQNLAAPGVTILDRHALGCGGAHSFGIQLENQIGDSKSVQDLREITPIHPISDHDYMLIQSLFRRALFALVS